jgi:sugar phosphate isomerase/epimerase
MPRGGTIELGVFSRTFARGEFSDVLDAVVDNDLELLHLNLKSAGVDPFTDELDLDTCKAIRAQINARGLTLIGVSSTFNAVHPNPEQRARETALAAGLISRAPALGTNFASLSTGTRHPDDMWRAHPANEERSAWADLQRTLERLLEAAHASDVVLGIEPERNNVVSSAARARRLLDEFDSERLKIILDPANLLSVETAPRQREIISEALELLAPDVYVVHAKDFSEGGECGAGLGLVDFALLFELLDQHSVHEPFLLHELPESDVGRARDFLLATAGQATTTRSELLQ